MLPFHDRHNLLEKSFSEQLELNPHLPPGDFYIPSSLPNFYIPDEGLHDLLYNLPSPLPPLPPPTVPLDETTISATSEAMKKNAASNESFSRRGAAGKDRHSKIHTATGPRDRRMRLSLEVARKFFNLQDMLRFDKASQTVQWLLNKSKSAIRELASVSSQNVCSFSHQSRESYSSECEDVASTISDSKGKSTMLQKCTTSEGKKHKAKKSASRSSRKPLLSNPTLTKEWRAKARERARERTREKKRMCCWTNSSASFDAGDDESGLMQNCYLTPQSLEERCLSNSHNYQNCMRSVENYDLQIGSSGGSELTPILAYDYNGNATSTFQKQCDMERVLLVDARTLYPFN